MVCGVYQSDGVIAYPCVSSTEDLKHYLSDVEGTVLIEGLVSELDVVRQPAFCSTIM